MDRVCSYCSATTNRSPIENCPACGESLDSSTEVSAEPFVPTEDEIDGAMESIAPTPEEEPESFEVPPELAAPEPAQEAAPIAETPAPTEPAVAEEIAAPAEPGPTPVAEAAPPEPAPEPAVEPPAPEPAVAQAVPPSRSEEKTPAEEKEAAVPQTRLRCRKCGAFVDPDASPDCPVCFEPTEGAIVVPWTPPPEPEEEKEAAPLEVSATSMPSEVVEAAKRSQERICTWCGAKVIPSATGICPSCGDVVPALAKPKAGEITTAPIPQDPDKPSSSFRRETPLRGDRPSGERKVVTAPVEPEPPRPPAVDVVRPTRERPVVPPRDPEFLPDRPTTGDPLALRVLLVAFGMAMGAAAMALTDRILDRVLK